MADIKTCISCEHYNNITGFCQKVQQFHLYIKDCPKQIENRQKSVPFWKYYLKLATLKLGINTHRILLSIFQRNAKNVLKNKCSKIDTATKELILNEDERYHYGDLEITEKASEYVISSFTIDRIKFIRENTPPGIEGLVADLGDTNGIFLRSCQRDGISVNMSDPVVVSLQKREMITVKANIAYLPFRDNSIHTCYLFQTLEHVQNPIALLHEIGRVCSNNLIVSIPFVEKTKIYSHHYNPYHIFEFNHDDFLKITTHTPFSLESETIAVVLDEKRTIFDRIVFFVWDLLVEHDTFCGCHKKFYICKLKKNKFDKNEQTI